MKIAYRRQGGLLNCTVVLAGIIFALPSSAIGQSRPIADDTLGNERSRVSPNEVINTLPSNRIDGGAQRGTNLFHSFQDFNIEAGRGVYFTNPADVANIITRVTGSSQSEILGTLGVLGSADLFLINPNGVFFGPDAQLDIQGSFLASTAESVVFGDDFAFSTVEPQALPLLTVNVPTGLQYGSSPGAVQTQEASLEVADSQTLILAGGTVTVDGGELLAPNGRLELAGVAALGELRLTQQAQGWQLNIAEGSLRENVTLTNGAFVSVRSNGSGSIGVHAQDFSILDVGTLVLAGILPGIISPGVKAGDIDVDVTQAINISVGGGFAGGMYNVTGRGSLGNGGNVNIATDGLTVAGAGARLSSVAYGEGNSGNININARDFIRFEGENVAVVSTLEESGTGRGGDINIDTGSLTFTGGAGINASTYGIGDTGDININARDTVTFDGIGNINGSVFSTGAGSVVQDFSTGNGGNITITTGVLKVTGGASLSTNTRSEGNAGNIIIVARDTAIFDGFTSNGRNSRATSGVASTGTGSGGDISITTGLLSVTEGAFLSTSTSGQGNAGNINIVTREAVRLEGTDRARSSSGAYSSVDPEAIGQGGSITVNTEFLSLTNEAELSASSEGQGVAGNLDITARQLNLSNQGKIIAETTSGQGGNIELRLQDFLVLRRGSFISATAGTAQAGGNGGNITFDGPFILAVPSENSDISANAFTGLGGSVNINAKSILGIRSRLEPTLQSDITASSELGVDGSVDINTPDVDPGQGLIELPVNFTDASQEIAQTCPTGNAIANQSNEFVITGRGGLPPTPGEAVNPDAVQVGLVTDSRDSKPSVSQRDPVSVLSELPPNSPIVEAQEFQIAADGTRSLIAAAPTNTLAASLNRQRPCS